MDNLPTTVNLRQKNLVFNLKNLDFRSKSELHIEILSIKFFD